MSLFDVFLIFILLLFGASIVMVIVVMVKERSSLGETIELMIALCSFAFCFVLFSHMLIPDVVNNINEKKGPSEEAVVDQWVTVTAADFDIDYNLKGGWVFLNQYKGNAASVIIPNTMKINGVDCVVELSNEVFERKNEEFIPVTNFIILCTDERVWTSFLSKEDDVMELGYIYIPGPTYNGVSMNQRVDISCFDAAKSVKALYYGGSEEELYDFLKIDTYKGVDKYHYGDKFEHIYYNASPQECYNAAMNDTELMQKLADLKAEKEKTVWQKLGEKIGFAA